MILGDVCSVHSGFTPRGRISDDPNGTPAVQQGDLAAVPLDPAALPRIDVTTDRFLVTSGDLVFRSRGQQPAAWVVPSTVREPLVAVMPLFILRPVVGSVDSRYLAWALNQPAAQRYFQQSSQGQNIQMVSKPVLESTPLLLPTIDRQRRIAEIAGLATREQALRSRLNDLEHQLIELRLAELARTASDSAIHDRRNAR